MAASIWSAPIHEIKKFPFDKFIQFFENHGLLKIRKRPKWRTVLNGSQEYVKKIISDYKIISHLNKTVHKIVRGKKKFFYLLLKGRKLLMRWFLHVTQIKV